MIWLVAVIFGSALRAATSLHPSCADELIKPTSQPLPRFHEDCRRAAREKIESVVRHAGGRVVEMTLVATSVDARPSSPSGYIWFSALATLPDGSVQRADTMTQKPAGRPCF